MLTRIVLPLLLLSSSVAVAQGPAPDCNQLRLERNVPWIQARELPLVKVMDGLVALLTTESRIELARLSKELEAASVPVPLDDPNEEVLSKSRAQARIRINKERRQIFEAHLHSAPVQGFLAKTPKAIVASVEGSTLKVAEGDRIDSPSEDMREAPITLAFAGDPERYLVYWTVKGTKSNGRERRLQKGELLNYGLPANCAQEGFSVTGPALDAILPQVGQTRLVDGGPPKTGAADPEVH